MLLLLFFSIFSAAFSTEYNMTIGNCDLTQQPSYAWLMTWGTGIMEWSTAGVKSNGPSFCLQGNSSAEYVQIAYHINLFNSTLPTPAPKLTKEKYNPATIPQNTNDCVNKDPRIVNCFPLCGDEMEEKVVRSALASGTTWVVANLIEKEINDPKWAITVLAVDYTNNATHLNVDNYINADVWCSVYIGINPTVGFPYLLEIQLGNVFQ